VWVCVFFLSAEAELARADQARSGGPIDIQLGIQATDPDISRPIPKTLAFPPKTLICQSYL